MKARFFLPAVLVAAIACSSQGEGEHSRGIGVYPGRPDECFAPQIVSGGKEYRNIALGRAAYHSSSWDYNLTAQLATDGIIPSDAAPWTETLINGEAPVKRMRHSLTDLNVTNISIPGEEAVCEVRLHGYAIEADKLIVAGGDYKDSEAKVEASVDGSEWVLLGTGKPVPTKDLKGENGDILHKMEWPVTLSQSGPFNYFRVTVKAKKTKNIILNDFFFYKDGKVLDLQPSTHFSSSWKSLGAEDEWISVDLGTVSSFDRMAFHWINPPVSGKIQVSNDNRRWKTVRTLGETDSFDAMTVRGRGRYVRALLDRTADGQPFELGEWEIFGRGGTALQASAPASRDGQRQPLSGGNWTLLRSSFTGATGEEISSPGFDDSGWMVATVPGTVLGSYVNSGAVPDPNYADNQLFISDSYFRSDFWYRDTFEAHPDSERQLLHFSGINYRAQVWLNGRDLGLIDGAFREQDFDVTGILAEGRNDIAVLIACNQHYGTVKEQTAYTPDLNGGIVGADNPTMHATIGWDWIPTVRGRDIGIYDEVALVYTGPVTVEEPFVRTELPLPDTTSATLFAQARLVNRSARAVSGVLRASFGDLRFRKEVSVPAGQDVLVCFDPATMENPRLWWPRGYGDPNLYDVSFVFEADGAVSDSVHFLSGVRQMDYKMEPFTPRGPQKFEGYDNNRRLSMYINGRRFIGFGGNWGFPEQLLNYRSREYDIAVGYHADMNFTMIRDWVGMIDNKAFYEACDRHGVMIWQDFWLANPWDGPDPYDPARFNEIAQQYVRRIRNHPSVALYVGRNEGYPPEEIESFLTEMIRREHPGLYYIPHSAADGVSGGGPYNALPAKNYYTLFGVDKMHSERGMPNVMNYENLVRALGEENVEPYNSAAHPNDMYGLHDYALGVGGFHAAQKANSFNELLEKAFGEPADAREFAALAQWINYDGYRAMFEARSEFRRGLQLWMSHPAWPSLVWQTYDYYFEPTAAYFGCKKACERIHIQFNALTHDVEVVNYRAGDQTGLCAEADVLYMDGRLAWGRKTALDVQEDQTVTCFPMDVPEDITDVYFLRLRLTRADGTLLSNNFYALGREEGNLRALRSLPKARVKLEKVKAQACCGPDVCRDASDGACQRSGGNCGGSAGSCGGDEIVEIVRLTNVGKTPALMLRLKALDSATGDLVLPVWYSDNYVSLMPGESVELRVKVRREDLRGRLRLEAEGCL